MIKLTFSFDLNLLLNLPLLAQFTFVATTCLATRWSRMAYPPCFLNLFCLEI